MEHVYLFEVAVVVDGEVVGDWKYVRFGWGRNRVSYAVGVVQLSWKFFCQHAPEYFVEFYPALSV